MAPLSTAFNAAGARGLLYAMVDYEENLVSGIDMPRAFDGAAPSNALPACGGTRRGELDRGSTNHPRFRPVPRQSEF